MASPMVCDCGHGGRERRCGVSEECGRLFDVADPYEDDDEVRLLRGGVVVDAGVVIVGCCGNCGCCGHCGSCRALWVLWVL